jgi:hypothetical protein
MSTVYTLVHNGCTWTIDTSVLTNPVGARLYTAVADTYRVASTLAQTLKLAPNHPLTTNPHAYYAFENDGFVRAAPPAVARPDVDADLLPTTDSDPYVPPSQAHSANFDPDAVLTPDPNGYTPARVGRPELGFSIGQGHAAAQ